MRVYLQLVKLFTSFAVFLRRPKLSRDHVTPRGNMTRPPGVPDGPVVPPKAPPPSPQLRSSSELMARTKRPRTRHHVKPLNAGWRAQEATTPLQPNLMSDRSHFARGASSDLLITRKAPSRVTPRYGAHPVRTGI